MPRIDYKPYQTFYYEETAIYYFDRWNDWLYS